MIQELKAFKDYKGRNGETGASNVLTIGTVTKGEEASASITGESPNQVLNLVLPKGDKGNTGDQGTAGQDGTNGISPILSETQTVNGYDITITDVNGTKTISLVNGQNGDKGDKGDPGEKGEQGIPGKDGKDGTNGQDGYTPQRGTDYWTATDIAAIESYCANYIDANITQVLGGSY